MLSTDEIVSAARDAKAAGASRFWMGAAWRSPTYRQVDAVADAVREVAALELQTCATLGMLTEGQAAALATAGLDYYNYNLDTSPEFYGEVITTRTYDDRLAAIANVRAAGVNLCCGGIVGMGASRDDRAGLLHQLASMDPHPESVPINLLVQVPGTPLDDVEPVDGLELVRTIAAARLLMPHSEVRLSAGRESMSDELQRLCLHPGANTSSSARSSSPRPTRDRAMTTSSSTSSACGWPVSPSAADGWSCRQTTQPIGVAGVKVKVETYLGTNLYCTFPIDLSTVLPFVAEVEHRRPRPVLEVPGIDPLPEFTLYPLPDQVADKVCAMYERHGPTATPSSRFRDLVDLVLIVSNFELDAAQTIRALTAESRRRDLALPARLETPDPTWLDGYREGREARASFASCMSFLLHCLLQGHA